MSKIPIEVAAEGLDHYLRHLYISHNWFTVGYNKPENTKIVVYLHKRNKDAVPNEWEGYPVVSEFVGGIIPA